MLDAGVSVEMGDGKRASALYDGFRNLTKAGSTPLGSDVLDFWIEQS